MKKNLYHFLFFRKMIALLAMFFMLSGTSFAQWAIYNASVLPDVNEPVFGTSGLAGAGVESTLIQDPDNPENSFLQMLTLAVADNGTWRYVYPDPVTEVTIVFRVKSADDNGRRVLEMDVDNGGFRERLYINQEDNLVRLQHSAGFGVDNEFPLPDEASVKDWNIYRITKDAAGNVKLYVNENPDPLAVGVTAQTTSNNHFRFGDTNGSHNVSALIDWVIWDTSGVYAPGEGTPIPAELLPEEPVEQSWFIYDGSVLPDVNEPAFGTSGLAGAGMASTLLADPANAENSLLQLVTLENADNGTWRQVFPEAVTDVTILMRVKAADDNGRRVLEMDIDNGGFRERLYINQEDNLLRLQHSADFGANNEFPLPGEASVKLWNVYRITKDAEGNVKLYINEDPTPLAEGKTSQATSNNHFRFGDTNGSHNVSALIDWVIWDTTGVYAPGQGLPIPEGLDTSAEQPQEPEPHNWRIYDANVFPHEQIPAFIVSSGTFNESENAIIPDPEMEGNQLLRMDMIGNPQNQFLWRQNFATQDIEFEELTVVMRAKGNAERDMIMDLDIHFNDKRSRISIHTATNLARIRNGVGENVELTNTLSDWNIYRFTMTATETRMYVNENPEAVLVFAPADAASANRHFRFGDGDSGNSMGADIDWVVWDYTGAFAPGEGSAIPSPVVTPNWDATLMDLMVNGELIDDFDPEVTEYHLVLPAGTTAVPQLDVKASNDGAKVEITQAEGLPGEAFVVVTAANGFTVKTYTVTMRLISTDATLADLKVNDVTIDGFSPEKLEYVITLAQGTTEVPTVTAIANDELSTVVITPAVGLPGETVIVVTAEDGSSIQVTILFQLDTTSVGEIDELKIKVYPNPASNVININFPASGEHVQLRLVSMYGQVVMHTPLNNTIDISNLKNGMYVLQLIDQDRTFEKIFIKQ